MNTMSNSVLILFLLRMMNHLLPPFPRFTGGSIICFGSNGQYHVDHLRG